MAQIIQKPTVTLNVTLQLSEDEARALEALAGYGTDGFLKVFYEKLGKAYLQPHEAGLCSLFESVRKTLPTLFRRAEDAREAFYRIPPPKTPDSPAV